MQLVILRERATIGRIYDTILENANKLYGKKELEKIFKNLKIKNYKFYYPLPNYKMPNVIFSDEYMPNENTTKLMYNITYEKGSVVVFDELKALKQVTKNGLFNFFANSYLIEMKLGNEKIDTDVRFVSYNNNRKEEYQLATIIKKENVIKKGISKKSEKHIKNIELNIKNLKKLGFNLIDEVNGNEIISKYVKEDTFDKLIIAKILDGNFNKAYKLISDWYEYIKTRLIQNKKSNLNENIDTKPEELENLTILKNGYIDLVFENTFYNNGDFLFFDQEWYEDGMPIEFLLYRAINNMYLYNLELEKHLPRTEVFEKFGLTNYLNLFEKIENFIQEEVINAEAVKINEKSLGYLHDINYTSLIMNQLKDFEENDKKQNYYIKALEDDNKRKQEYIEILEEKNKQYAKQLEESKKSFWKR